MGLGYEIVRVLVYLFLDFLYSNLLGSADDPTVRSTRGERRARRGGEDEGEALEEERDVENRVA